MFRSICNLNWNRVQWMEMMSKQNTRERLLSQSVGSAPALQWDYFKCAGCCGIAASPLSIASPQCSFAGGSTQGFSSQNFNNIMPSNLWISWSNLDTQATVISGCTQPVREQVASKALVGLIHINTSPGSLVNPTHSLQPLCLLSAWFSSHRPLR